MACGNAEKPKHASPSEVSNPVKESDLTTVTITPEAQQHFIGLAPNLSLASGRNLYIPTDAVPEPSTWAMMIIGFGAAGAMLRRKIARRGAVG